MNKKQLTGKLSAIGLELSRTDSPEGRWFINLDEGLYFKTLSQVENFYNLYSYIRYQ